MKLKTTKKQITDQAKNVYSVGYCSLQYLLKYKNEFAYSAGVNGWSCDYYKLNNDHLGIGMILSTGYSPTGKTIPSKIVKKYEEKAMIHTTGVGYNKSYNENKIFLNNLIDEFIKEVDQHFYTW